MFIVVLYCEEGDFYPMYWHGGWNAIREGAWQYTEEDAQELAINLEDWYGERCVRVIQVS